VKTFGTPRNDGEIPAVIAGILEANGGFRVVLTEPHNLRLHVHDGERMFVVPDVRFFGPAPASMFEYVVEAARFETNLRLALEHSNMFV
jgi:hypothetical protein